MTASYSPMIDIQNVSKTFTLHNQGSALIPVMEGATLSVNPGTFNF